MRCIALAANNGWSVINFRSGLIRALMANGYDVAVIGPDGPHSGAIRALGARFHPLPMQPRGKSPAADLKLFLGYRRLLRAIGPTAFLGFTAKPNIWGSLAARSLRIAVINNISGLGTAFIAGGRLERIVSGLYRLALRGSSTVFFQNRDDRDLFINRRLVRLDQTELLPGSGVDLDHFAPRARGSGPFTFLLPARLIWDKGITEFVEAARLLRGRRDDKPQFQLLGGIEPPTPQSVPKAEVDRWVADGTIEYCGVTEDVRPFFAQADCIVLPSYREGLPRTLLEAAAMERPVITTDVPGCRDAVDDGATGLLCSARSAESLAEAMERMIDLGPERRRAMGKAGQHRVERLFDQRLVHRAYLDALTRTVLDKS